LLYTGCKSSALRPTDNMAASRRELKTYSAKREVIARAAAWRVRQGKYLADKYRVCNGGDCATFDLSCNKPIGPGYRVGHWQVIHVKTGRNSYRMHCPRNTRFPKGASKTTCPKNNVKRRKVQSKPQSRPRSFAFGSNSGIAADVAVGTKSGGYCSDQWVREATAESNTIRRRYGANNHGCDEGLAREAAKYSRKLCKLRDLTHNGFADRCRAAGYPSMCAENLLWNMDSSNNAPDVAVEQWRVSPGHFKNLISTSTNVVGYGYADCGNGRIYWTGLYSKN